MKTESATGRSGEAPAKLNLGLHVIGRRGDGYHDIETVFLRIGWSDVVTVDAADELSMACSDEALPVDERNTCLRAARLLAERFDCDHGARIFLDKRVPYGAGLGSGSSDAATTLRLLDELWGLSATPSDLHAVALEVGSDVPFFLNGAMAYAEGRGDRLTPLECDDRRTRHVVVAVPPVHVASGAAYALVTPRPGPRAPLRDVVCSHDLARWRRELVNDFEEPVCGRHPEIEGARRELLRAGAEYASLSGSGSAVYGFFPTLDGATRASASADLARLRVWVGEVEL